MRKYYLHFLFLFSFGSHCIAQEHPDINTSGSSIRLPQIFSLFAGGGLGYQYVGHSDNLRNPRAGLKFEAGISLDFNADCLRKKNPHKVSWILSYNLMATADCIHFLSYYDTPANDSFEHNIRLTRLAPSLKLKVRANNCKHQPFVSFGFVARELYMKRSIEVSQNGIVHFAKGNFQPWPIGLLLINSVVMAVPIAGPLLISSCPEIEIGASLGEEARLDLILSITTFDSINISSLSWNYTTYQTDLDFGAMLSRTTVLLKIKYKLL